LALAGAIPVLVGIAIGARGDDGGRHDDEGHLTEGEALYAAHCASCHGASLEGQPDWRFAGLDGTFPAPQHSAEGHTWHHSDALLLDYVKRGGAAALADMGVEFRSAMPAFGDVLTDDDIRSVLAFIASTWPEDIRAAQEAAE